jgi:hypothetical protein
MPLPAQLELGKEEKIIERGMKSFVEVGTALMRIRDSDLYTVTHNTFESYCKERWGMERRQAYRLIDGAKVAELCPIGHKPSSESVARALTGIRNEGGELDLIKIGKVWQKAVDTAPDGNVTAKHVKNIVKGKIRNPKQVKLNGDTSGLKLGSQAMNTAETAIMHLKGILGNDPERIKALHRVIKFCKDQIKGVKV